jgi:hypothetical protein
MNMPTNVVFNACVAGLAALVLAGGGMKPATSNSAPETRASPTVAAAAAFRSPKEGEKITATIRAGAGNSTTGYV